MNPEHGADQRGTPDSIAGRYCVQHALGRGGMAVVYRVTDTVRGRDMALKQLCVTNPKYVREATVLFEREFHTLAQLSHPRVIEVYDYGVEPDGPYYTMELLDGLDLRERSPLPWREACALLWDVCSSLALLHSRRLVHRDVSPRNIRCTQGGLGKLIDFGALLPMGAGGNVIGTPAFTAPEVIHRLATDARTDLYSLGATLYYALTGRPPYQAREFADLAGAWAHKPPPPSALRPEVPPALDKLVLALLSLEPASRPRSAFEVMHKLQVLSGIERIEPLSVSQAYLSTPVLVGRDAERAAVRERIAAAVAGRGGGVLISGPAGAGRSRMLDACVLEAKTLGAVVLRAGAGAGARADATVAHALAEQLHEALPEAARDPGEPTAASFERAARAQALVIAVDDVHAIDASSAALLATLAHGAARTRLMLAFTAETPPPETAPPALQVIASHCTALPLPPLDDAQTLELLKSVFGDVPGIGIVAGRIHEVARGNPRECMDLAQHLCDNGIVRYGEGSWALPSQLAVEELPSSGEQALCTRVARLPELARFLTEVHALASHDTFTREDYRAVAAPHDLQHVEQALSELVARGVLVGAGRSFALAHGKRAAAALTAGLGPAELLERHRALAALYEPNPDAGIAAVYHLFMAGCDERALDRLLALVPIADARGGVIAMPVIGRHHLPIAFERALVACAALARPPRQLAELRRWLVTLSIVVEDALYYGHGPAWLEQLERDSGLAAYRALDESAPGMRLQRALEQTAARHAATPERERVYPIDEAIKLLVQYVAISIAIGARTVDARLIASLPPLLEPFTPLSPLVDAMWQNAICTVEVNCAGLPERARLRASDLYTRLSGYSDAELPYVSYIRHALAYCAGAIDAGLGLRSAMRWAEILDQDLLQKVNAMYIRKIVRLQQGDPEGAERFRKQAELLAVQATARQMFNTTAAGDLNACTLAHDLTGVKQACQVIDALAQRHPGWTASRHLGEGHFERLRGNLQAALLAYQRCLELARPDPAEPWRSIRTWPIAVAGSMLALIELGRYEEARAQGEECIALGRARGLGVVLHEVARALALAEARLGDYERAAARLSEVIDAQRALGVSGLQLGASYEARARIAIWAGDGAAVEQFGRLTAREYRHGRGSPLGALYDRLMDEARRAGVSVLPQLSEFESTMMSATKLGPRAPAAAVAATLSAEHGRAQRSARGLALISAARGASRGYLYLVGDHGLELAAADGDEPPASLLEFVREQATYELASELTTAPASAAPTQSTSRTMAWAHPLGGLYRPFVITCEVDGEPGCAGVAVLLLDPARQPQPGAAEIVTAVGAQLLAAGDTRAMSRATAGKHDTGPRISVTPRRSSRET